MQKQRRKKEDAVQTEKKITVPTLECTRDTLEEPKGDIIYQRKDTTMGEEMFTRIFWGTDSLMIYSYVPGIGNGTLTESDITALAYSDIDPAPDQLKTNEFDLELTDGTKQHMFVLYVNAKKEQKLFRNVTYTCKDPDVHFKNYPAMTVTIACNSMDIAKQTVEKIESKLNASK